MVDYKLIDHTADIGIIVSAKDLKSLFVKSAEAMFDVIALKKRTSRRLRKKEIKITLKAKNTEELLVYWLSELLSLSDCEDVFFTEFDMAKLKDTALEAKASGLSRSHFIGKREVKAVTYHELKIKKKGSRYQAEVIFDV